MQIEAQVLSVDYGNMRVVNSVSLTIRTGELVGLIGPNGAGKTTCFNLLTKFITPTAGQIIYKGQDITQKSSAEIARIGMVRSFQISAVFPHLSVLENVRLALQQRTGTSMHFWKSETTLNHLNDEAMTYIEQVGLENYAQDTAVSLPYGRKRALEIATTLGMSPDLMLLDEPTQGMGHEDVEKVTQLIKKVSAGRTVLMVEHNMKVVSSIVDTITVLQRGKIIANGNYAEVSNNPQVIEAYMGSSTNATLGAH